MLSWHPFHPLHGLQLFIFWLLLVPSQLSVSSGGVNYRLPAELQKKVSSLLSSPVEQLQVLSSAVLRESSLGLDHNQINTSPLNSHTAALLLSQVHLV